MGLETGTTIQNLVSTNPTEQDYEAQGDDHIRLLKTVLKTIFPGTSGQGFNTPITATEQQLNYVSGATSNIQTQLNALDSRMNDNTSNIASNTNAINAHSSSIATLNSQVADLYSKVMPGGTHVMFFQAAPPVGWTRNASFDNRMVMAGEHSVGGLHDPTIMNLVPDHVHNHNFTLSNNPAGAHSHSVEYTGISGPVSVQSGSGATAIPNIFTRNTTTVGDHNHSMNFSGNIQGVPGATPWQPYYIKGIVCYKN